jgi:hypothetical protein
LGLVVAMAGMVEGRADARGKVSRALLKKVKGKSFFTNMVLTDKSFATLVEKFADKQPSIALRRASDNTWSVTMVSFPSRRPAGGPVMLWLTRKGGDGKPIVTKTVERRKLKPHLVYDLLLDGEKGFRMCNTYVIELGQIIRKKYKVYAAGELRTDPDNPRCRGRKGK